MNTYDYDTTGIEMQGNFEPIPIGNYLLMIEEVTEKVSKNNDPLFNVRCVVAEGPYSERKVWHNVTLLPRERDGKKVAGAGMAVHFLKTIRQPHEGKIKVNPENWIGECFMAYVGIEKDIKGNDRNFIAKLWAYDGQLPEKKAGEKPVPQEETDVPF